MSKTTNKNDIDDLINKFSSLYSKRYCKGEKVVIEKPDIKNIKNDMSFLKEKILYFKKLRTGFYDPKQIYADLLESLDFSNTKKEVSPRHIKRNSKHSYMSDNNNSHKEDDDMYNDKYDLDYSHTIDFEISQSFIARESFLNISQNAMLTNPSIFRIKDKNDMSFNVSNIFKVNEEDSFIEQNKDSSIILGKKHDLELIGEEQDENSVNNSNNNIKGYTPKEQPQSVVGDSMVPTQENENKSNRDFGTDAFGSFSKDKKTSVLSNISNNIKAESIPKLNLPNLNSILEQDQEASSSNVNNRDSVSKRNDLYYDDKDEKDAFNIDTLENQRRNTEKSDSLMQSTSQLSDKHFGTKSVGNNSVAEENFKQFNQLDSLLSGFIVNRSIDRKSVV